MKRRKKRQKKLIALAVIATLGILIVFLSYNLKDKKNLNLVEKVIKDSSIFITNIVTSPIDFVIKKIDLYKEKKDIYNKYKDMEKRANQTDLIIAEKEELLKQLNDLKKTLKLNEVLTDYEMVNATVVNRNIGYWFHEITINKGSKDGIEVNMPVIVNEGLVGKVTKTSNYNSTVRLLTNNEIGDKISVKIQNEDSFVYGLLINYMAKENAYVVEGISNDIKIELGSLVTTTGLSDYFPSGILIGKVSEITTDNFDLSKIVKVTPDIDFNDISYVTVLMREIDD